MYSLKSLLEVGDYSAFTTKQTGIDPETGKISWDVEYYPDFSAIFKKLDDVIRNIQSAEKDEHINDPIINQSIKALKATKKALEIRIQDKYPQYIK